MSRALFSASWYRVADLKPRLRAHVQMHRQRYRGQVWYILQDHASGRFHRFTPSAHVLIGLMNGRHSINEIWEMASERLGDDLPTQDEVIRLLAQLHQSDVLQSDVPPDVLEMVRRADKVRTRDLMLRIRNPMALRFPLLDPDRFLEATLPLVRWLFNPASFVLWLGLIIYAAALGILHWSEITTDIYDRALATQNVVLMILVYPFIKTLHELGHGYAVKRWGGEVHEMGIMLLVFMPVPYVDASSSSAFRDRHQRAVVGAAGIMVEVTIAAIGLLLWLNVEPGLVRAIAFNMIIVGGVSTVLFNGNPLLRFDGYYVATDLLEIPNLGTRANRYLLYIIKRHLFGVDEISPATAPGEAGWFVVYGLASFVYRLFIMVSISLFVAGKFFFIGVALALWTVIVMLVVPVGKAIRYLVSDPALHRKRKRALAWTGGFAFAVAAILVLIPMPLATLAEGVVWVPERARVLAATQGNIARLLAQPNSDVTVGMPLVEMVDPYLAAEVRVLEAELTEHKLRLAAMEIEDRVQADILRQQVRATEEDLSLRLARQRDLVVHSSVAGRFVVPDGEDIVGRFLQKGSLIGYVLRHDKPTVRVVVPQEDIDLVRQRTRKVSVRLSDRFDSVSTMNIVREIPAASHVLPSPAMSAVGGGKFAIDPRQKESLAVHAPIFELDLGFRVPISTRLVGGRVYVRFDHGSEPLVFRLYRGARQLFLRQFNV